MREDEVELYYQVQQGDKLIYFILKDYLNKKLQIRAKSHLEP
jgi:uncharacterized protein YgiM (DUF1202 family)